MVFFKTELELPASPSSEVPAKSSSSSSSSSGKGLATKTGRAHTVSWVTVLVTFTTHMLMMQSCEPGTTYPVHIGEDQAYRGKSSSCHSSLSSTPSILRRASVVATDSWRSRLEVDRHMYQFTCCVLRETVKIHYLKAFK